MARTLPDRSSLDCNSEAFFPPSVAQHTGWRDDDGALAVTQVQSGLFDRREDSGRVHTGVPRVRALRHVNCRSRDVLEAINVRSYGRVPRLRTLRTPDASIRHARGIVCAPPRELPSCHRHVSAQSYS